MDRLTLALLLLLPLLPAAVAEPATDLFGREIWIPEGWEEPEVTTPGRAGKSSFKPSTPRELKARRVGATVGLQSVSVHKTKAPASTRKYRLKLAGGKTAEVCAGEALRIDDRRFKVLGERDGALLLQDQRSKRVMRFVKKQQPAPEGERP